MHQCKEGLYYDLDNDTALIIIPWTGYSATMEHIIYSHSHIDHDEHTPLTKANMMVMVIEGIFTLPVLDEQTDEYHKGVCTMTAPTSKFV